MIKQLLTLNSSELNTKLIKTQLIRTINQGIALAFFNCQGSLAIAVLYADLHVSAAGQNDHTQSINQITSGATIKNKAGKNLDL